MKSRLFTSGNFIRSKGIQWELHVKACSRRGFACGFGVRHEILGPEFAACGLCANISGGCQPLPTRQYLLTESTNMIVHTALDADTLGQAAAEHAAFRIRELASQAPLVSVLFATGESQLKTLRALTAVPDVPWNRVIGFHMDEYLGIRADHSASFRRYLKDELVSRVPLLRFYYLQGDAPDPDAECRRYGAELRANPPQLCLLGIGENGHLAFNDPGEANFNDPETVRIVKLDKVCRQQQVNEGWFKTLEDVPAGAITLTVPALMAVQELIVSAPGERKADIVGRFLRETISAALPATILRQHPNVTIYLDRASAVYKE